MFDHEYEEEPTVVDEMMVLDCAPGRFGDRVNGDPVAIITYGNGDEIAKTTLPMRDCRALVRGLLTVLVHFDDQAAARGLEAMSQDEQGA